MDIEKLKTRHLPEEIIAEEILPRLPVKSVLRLRCVSKAWRCLIGSERFIKTHLQFSAKNKTRGSVISGCVLLHHCSVESLLKEPITYPKLLVPMEDVGVVDGLVCMSSSSPQSLVIPMEDVRVVGCCNGLVCMKSSSRGRFFLWNPSARISKELPIGRVGVSRSTATGFGWDESSGANKVCVFADVPGSGRRVFEVYSSKTNSWKTVDDGRERDLLRLCGEGQFVSGKVHWRHNVGIVSFDLKSEVFGVMEQPRGCRCDPKRVLFGVLGGCLCLVSTDYEKRLDVWVMKEESWFHMVAAVPLVPYYKPTMKTPFPASFVAAPNGQIWLAYGSGYLAYDPKQKLVLPFKQIKGGTGFFNPHLCVESLVRPYIDT